MYGHHLCENDTLTCIGCDTTHTMKAVLGFMSMISLLAFTHAVSQVLAHHGLSKAVAVSSVCVWPFTRL